VAENDREGLTEFTTGQGQVGLAQACGAHPNDDLMLSRSPSLHIRHDETGSRVEDNSSSHGSDLPVE
jgi:hypothetical protein